MQSGNLSRPESIGPMRFVQLTSQARLADGHSRYCEEAVLKVTGQTRTVLQVRDRLSLSVQNGLYSLDDRIAMGEKESEKLDVCLKWPLTM